MLNGIEIQNGCRFNCRHRDLGIFLDLCGTSVFDKCNQSFAEAHITKTSTVCLYLSYFKCSFCLNCIPSSLLMKIRN